MRLPGKLQLLIFVAFLLFSFLNLLKAIADFLSQHRSESTYQYVSQERPKPKFIKLSDNLFVFSSFVDARHGNMGFPFFRIIAILRSRQYTYYCIFKQRRIQAQIYAMAENHGRLYGTYMLSCRIPENFIVTTSKIGLTDGNHTQQLTPTYYVPPEATLKRFAYVYSICLPFFYGHFYPASYLVEAIEMHKLLGVQQITVYATMRKLDLDIRSVLEYYAAQRILDVIDFEQPVVDIWNHGQLAVINDCLYRNMGRARYVSFQDWDEIIIPTLNSDLPSLFQTIFFNSSIASFRISTLYFHFSRTYPSLINSVQAENERLDTEYTKCVVRPEMIFEQGIHHTSRVIQDHYLSLKLPNNEAILHHYVEHTYAQTSPVSTIPLRYGKKLHRNCDAVLRKIYTN